MAGKGGLLAEIEAAVIDAVPVRCAVAKALAGLGPEADDLQKALDDERIVAPVIVKVLTARGFKMAQLSVQRHRRGACSCGPR